MYKPSLSSNLNFNIKLVRLLPRLFFQRKLSLNCSRGPTLRWLLLTTQLISYLIFAKEQKTRKDYSLLTELVLVCALKWLIGWLKCSLHTKWVNKHFSEVSTWWTLTWKIVQLDFRLKICIWLVSLQCSQHPSMKKFILWSWTLSTIR